MYGFCYTMSKAVYHNRVFSHNMYRQLTLHASQESQTRALIVLEPAKTTVVSSTLTITTSDEIILSVDHLGKAVRHSGYDYVKD